MNKHNWLSWGSIISSAVLILVLGGCGYLAMGYTPIHALYAGLQLFVLEASFGPTQQIPLALNIARILAPIVMAATAIRAAMLLLRKEIAAWKRSRLQGHIVLCGLGRKGYELAKQYMKDNEIVIIDRDECNDFIGTCRDGGAHVLIGDITDPSMLEKARAGFASEVYFMTGSDGANFSALTLLAKINETTAQQERKQKAWLHLYSIAICSFLRDETILERIRQTVDFEIVSLFEAAARDLVVNELIPLLPVRPDDSRQLHLVQVGMGRMGQSIIRKLAQCAVTANGKHPKVTVVAMDPKHDLKKLEGDIPSIGRFCELEEPLSDDILHRDTQGKIVETLKTARDAGEVPVVCLAVNSQYTNISAALFLADHFTSAGLKNIPLYVRLTESEGWGALAEDLSEQREGPYRLIKGFGELSKLCHCDVLKQTQLNAMARTLHEAYLKQHGDGTKPSHRPWDELPWTFRTSNQQAADHLRVKLRTIGLDLVDGPVSNPIPFDPSEKEWSLLAQLEHRRWSVEKELLKWTPGKHTNYQKKVHACLDEWDSLSPDDQSKDFNQILTYNDAIKAGGYSIIREVANTDELSSGPV